MIHSSLRNKDVDQIHQEIWVICQNRPYLHFLDIKDAVTDHPEAYPFLWSQVFNKSLQRARTVTTMILKYYGWKIRSNRSNRGRVVYTRPQVRLC